MATDEKPLVTFALLSYNQEKYIREAVEAALAQDYPNLEIIISDDCSTDGTVEQARLVVADYKGPHRVSLRSTKSNCGPFRHVLDVAAIANGKVLVLAAGDDISKITRVSRLAKAWTAGDVWGMSSRYDTIDAFGNVTGVNLRTEELFSPEFDLRRYFKDDNDISIVHGATSAYSIELFRKISAFDAPWILAEDGTLSLIINFLGKKIIHLDESLVNYRVHHEALTNSPEVVSDRESLQAFIRKRASYALSSKNRAEFFLDFAEKYCVSGKKEINHSFVRSDIARQAFQAAWMEMGFFQRLARTIAEPGNWRWSIPRIFGVNFYVAIKIIRDRFVGRP